MCHKAQTDNGNVRQVIPNSIMDDFKWKCSMKWIMTTLYLYCNAEVLICILKTKRFTFGMIM